eukprot:gnl/MRDRNA2_/MRDRNA2_109797_c0_seq1.p1 gnl/MRDRNA2_/MRDRNA2_109797_c0~~gnl/MRDRNA2_/MRDRNA2_109797_c0_seq1.p1  ORF type:complete len:637 (+),score=112.42 gnl/MRDRNA2_/MRDRNA2_109797_c0_seq1:131-2041(+)
MAEPTICPPVAMGRTTMGMLGYSDEDIERGVITASDEPTPMPLKRFCGRCASLSPKEVGKVFPGRVNFEMKPPKKEMDKFRGDWWADDFEKVELCPPPPRSAFSRKPHPQFQHLTCFEVSNVETQILQNAKTQYMQQLASTSGLREIREAKEDADLSIIRAICRKDPEERTYDELQSLTEFLADKEFFQEIPEDVMPLIAQQVGAFRIEGGDVAYTQGEDANKIFLILKGRVVVSEGDSEGSTKSNSAMRTQYNALGVGDVTEEGSVMRVKAQPIRLLTCKATQRTETLFLTTDALREAQKQYEEQAIREKLAFLLKYFSATKGLSERELRKETHFDPDRALHQLFTSEEVPRHKCLLQEGIKLPLDEATVFIILDGEVELKARGKVVNTLSVGAVLGEDALYNEPSRVGATVISDRVKLLAISVKDYLQQFEKRDRPMVRPKTNEKRDKGFMSTSSIDPKVHAETLKRPLKLLEDMTTLHTVDWKLLHSKQAPKRVAPRCSDSAASSGAAYKDLEASRRRRRNSGGTSQPAERRVKTQNLDSLFTQERPPWHQEVRSRIALEHRVGQQEEASRMLAQTHTHHKLHCSHYEHADHSFGDTASTMFPSTRPSSTRSSAVLMASGAMNVHKKPQTARM